MVRNEGDRLVKVAVCAPKKEYFCVAEPGLHNIEQVANRDQAIKQHQEFCRIIQQAGVDVIKIPELSDHPNSVFTRDTCVCTPCGFIELRMGLASRQGEEHWMARFLEGVGYKKCGMIHEPGILEGGDIILAGNVVFIGRSRRSNDAGIHQLKGLLEVMDFEVRIADVPSPRLHIGGMMSMVGSKRILCCEELFPKNFFDGFETISVPAENFISGNVIYLSENTVIAEEKNSSAISCFEQAGMFVHAVNLSEFVKGRGGPTCLIMPLERGSK